MKYLSYIFIALVLSSVYLFAWPSPTIPYFVIIALHVALGVVFAILFVPAIARLLRGASWGGRIGWAAAAFGAAAGIALLFTGARRAEWPVLYAHILACVVAAIFLASDWAGRRAWLGTCRRSAIMWLAIFIAAGVAISGGAWWLRNIPWQHSHQIVNPAIAPATMENEGDGPQGSFFPSSAQTAHHGNIPSSYFMESRACQRCHAEIYKEWQGSMHHFSSFNNQWYRKSIEYMQDVNGVRPSKWCGGCHDPALLYSGLMDTPIKQIVNTPPAQAGLGCMMCHSIAQVKSTMGQADFTLEYPLLHQMASSSNPIVRGVHDFLTEINPEPHRRVFLKPFMRSQTADFCSSCHKVHLDVPVNNYRWIRGFNDYDNWQASGVSGLGARSFYYPANPQNCADCHMPAVKSNEAGNINGSIHSHRFFAANTAVPFANQDATQLAGSEKFLQDKIISVDIFGITPEPAESASTPASPPVGSSAPGLSTSFAVGEEAEFNAPVGATPENESAPSQLTAPLSRVHPALRRGDTGRLDVVVRTRKVGHFFPGGTVDAFECWLQLSATDESGKVIFVSGDVADNGRGAVDPGAHFYRSLQIDAHGNPINKRNAWSTRATVYARLIPPGAADTVHFRLQIPKDAANRIHLRARLNYRKFSWFNTQFAFAGESGAYAPADAVTKAYDDREVDFKGDTSRVSGNIKAIPNPPIVIIAEDQIDLPVIAASAPAPAPQIVGDPADWQRWNDYGIGLFLQGDLRAAETAFEEIAKIDPKNPDGWVNVGRVRVQEGNIGAAKQVLERAIELNPDLARAHYFYARVLRSEGKYADAIAHLRLVTTQYPRDRVVHDDLGRILFLQRRYPEAITEFQNTLSIDPEDLEANYNLMLCYTGVSQPDRAAEFQKRYLRFKADESSQALVGPYLRAHADDNRERQPIHEHLSSLLDAKAKKIVAGAMSAARRGGQTESGGGSK